MSGSGERRPIVIVIACAVLAALILVFGVSCGGANDAAAKDWQKSFTSLAKGAPLRGEDLAGSNEQCQAAGTQLLVTGSCIFQVREFGGALGLGPPTKRAVMVPQKAVAIELFVEGTRIEQDADAGDQVELTFGKSGGRLAITCPSVGGCALQLQEAGG